MHAFLIINNQPSITKQLTAEISKQQKITRVIPFPVQTIDDARLLKKVTKLSFNEKSAIVINDIDNAGDEAINALLKELEEPSKNLSFILTARNINNVLPTITSRCEIIQVASSKYHVASSRAKEFLEQNLNKKFEIIGKIKEREEAIKFVEDLIYSDEKILVKENYLKTLKNLKLNGNVSLQLANLVVTMSSQN